MCKKFFCLDIHDKNFTNILKLQRDVKQIKTTLKKLETTIFKIAAGQIILTHNASYVSPRTSEMISHCTSQPFPLSTEDDIKDISQIKAAMMRQRHTSWHWSKKTKKKY